MNGDDKLIESLNRSDKAAFEHLYGKYVKMVYGFLSSVLSDNHMAEDLTQWCFMQLWDHRREISSGRNLPAWLYVTARNAAYKEMRRQLRAARYVDDALLDKDAADTIPTPASEMQVIIDELSAAVKDLPDARRKIFCMKTVEGLSVKEIAQELNISPKTVETQIARAKSYLRRKVSELLFVAIIACFGL